MQPCENLCGSASVHAHPRDLRTSSPSVWEWVILESSVKVSLVAEQTQNEGTARLERPVQSGGNLTGTLVCIRGARPASDGTVLAGGVSMPITQDVQSRVTRLMDRNVPLCTRCRSWVQPHPRGAISKTTGTQGLNLGTSGPRLPKAIQCDIYCDPDLEMPAARRPPSSQLGQRAEGGPGSAG